MLRQLRRSAPSLPPEPLDRWHPTNDPISQDGISDCRHLLAVVDQHSQVADIAALLRAWVMGPVLNPSANWLTFADLTTPEARKATARSWAGPDADWPDNPLLCLHRLLQLRHEALSAGLALKGRVVVAMPLEGALHSAMPAIAQARARGIFMAPIILADDAVADEEAYRYFEGYAEHLILTPHAVAPGMPRNFSGSLRFFRTITHKNYY